MLDIRAMSVRSLVEKPSKFPRIGLAQLAAPLEPMRRLTTHFGGPRIG
jgi:hypothetical protein